jgi:hypothetical protein
MQDKLHAGQYSLFLSKPPHRNKKGIGCKQKMSSFDYKAEWDTLSLPNQAHHFQVYSAAVMSADNIVINKTPLVISPTKEDTTRGGRGQIEVFGQTVLSIISFFTIVICWYICEIE